MEWSDGKSTCGNGEVLELWSPREVLGATSWGTWLAAADDAGVVHDFEPRTCSWGAMDGPGPGFGLAFEQERRRAS